MVKARKFIYCSAFVEEPKMSDFRLETEDLPELNDGDVLVEAVYLSVDPYMRVQMPMLPINSTMIGEQIARIIESKDDKFPVNAYVWGYFGWRSHSIFNTTNKNESKDSISPYVLQPIDNISWSSRLGVLGMTGNSAYFGFLEICQPKAGETVVISGAAGAVGSIVGQIAKIKECIVIGLAGSDSKCKWLKNELKFDHAINYKSKNISELLKTIAPNGIDCFFDNVGGELSSIVVSQMNSFGRVSVCGSISTYNSKDSISDLPKATVLQPSIVAKQLKIEGFIISRWFNRWSEGIENLQTWINKGQLTYRETITIGFENLPQAFIGMMRGENIGKALVKA